MSTRQRVQDLVSYVEQGRMIEAMTEFYADDVVMQENLGPATAGLAANLERERAFYGSLLSVHFHARSIAVDGDIATINWIFDFTTPDGKEVRLDEIAHQTWRDGRIVRERFYYDTGAAAAA